VRRVTKKCVICALKVIYMDISVWYLLCWWWDAAKALSSELLNMVSSMVDAHGSDGPLQEHMNADGCVMIFMDI